MTPPLRDPLPCACRYRHQHHALLAATRQLPATTVRHTKRHAIVATPSSSDPYRHAARSAFAPFFAMFFALPRIFFSVNRPRMPQRALICLRKCGWRCADVAMRHAQRICALMHQRHAHAIFVMFFTDETLRAIFHRCSICLRARQSDLI